ncbi:MAG: hypothetical protein ACRDY0_03575 [Acidimicrobiales bacterium]
MNVVDEYIAVRVLRGRWPEALPDDEDLALPASAHWRLLQAVHGDRGGQLSGLFAGASPAVINTIRWPHPEVLQILDPRPLLDRAAMLANRYGGGLLIGETLAAGLANGRQLFFGTARNIGPRLRAGADDLGVTIYLSA